MHLRHQAVLGDVVIRHHGTVIKTTGDGVMAAFLGAADAIACAVESQQAIHAWIAATETRPELTLAWLREAPALGETARRLQRESADKMVAMIQLLGDSPQLRASGVGPVRKELALLLLGGLCELTASTMEDGGKIGDIAEVAIDAAMALLGPPPPRK